jgi:GGDEF domain-containing protein
MADAVALSAVAFDNAEVRFDDPAEPARVIERRERTDGAAASSTTLAEHGAVLAVDVEGIERVVAECGLAAAEAVLAHVASRLAATVRAVDEVVVRGPNTFAAVCRPPVDRVAVISIANRIVRVLSGPYFVDGPDSEQLARRIDHLSVNVGIAFQTVSSELDDAIERAEDAMRVAASEGTNEWRISDGGRRQRVPL